MNHTLTAVAALCPLVAAGSPPATGPGDLRYEIDLSDPSDDLFHVTVYPNGLDEEDRHFDFVAFAPGVHSVLDFGRFVQSLAAFDAEGEEVATKRIDTNRWELADPARVERIVYAIEDSYDAEIQEHRVLPCAGSGIEEDHVLLNPFAVLGYFERRLARPVEIRIDHDPGWSVGTALSPKDGTYRAESYRHLADSPFLMGDLSTVGIWVGDIQVDIFVQSPRAGLNAEEVLFVAGDALVAAELFIGFAPVDRYVFLMSFIGRDSMMRNRFRAFGALEHSYSSLYTLPATGNLDALSGTIAHEFMHILTPLHLKSTIIADFDYSIPTTDSHLWLYEGVTEWSSDMLRLRGGVIGLDAYLDEMTTKIRMTTRFDPDYSLLRLSHEWSTPEGLGQYGNIYQLGALTAALLDLRILELSGGEKGLREVFLELAKRFGRSTPFDEATFFDELVAASYPEVADFVRDYIQDNQPLPYEAFGKLGLELAADGSLSAKADPSEEELAFREAWMRSLAED